MKIFLTILSLTVMLLAQKVFVGSPHQRSITIYNNGIAFVQESKGFELQKNGSAYIVYEGVPDSIIIDSVLPEFSYKDTLLYSQTFEKNRVDSSVLLEYYKKHTLPIKFFKPTNSANERVLANGYILSNGSSVTIKDKNGRVYLVSLKDIVFPALPKELSLTKPSLTWRVKGKKGKQSVKLSYLTRGVKWRANYTINLAKKAKLTGWITIDNRSGISYKDMKIYCIAGSVNVVRNIGKSMRVMFKSAMPTSENIAVKEESFGGFHLYKIPFKEDIELGSKQIKFISKKSVAYNEFAKLRWSMPTYPLRGVKKYSLSHIVYLKNDKTSGLGLPLPKGKIRVYKKDKSNNTHFLGESFIAHTPINDDIYLNIGKFFDIKVKVKQIAYKASRNRHHIYSKVNIQISNEDEKARVIKLDTFYNPIGNYTMKSNCKNICKDKDISSGLKRFTIVLPSHKSYNFDLEYESENR